MRAWASSIAGRQAGAVPVQGWGRFEGGHQVLIPGRRGDGAMRAGLEARQRRLLLDELRGNVRASWTLK